MGIGNEAISALFSDQMKNALPFNVFLNDYFGKLKDQNVKFCVLSGYVGLPDVYHSDDIDILVSKGDLREASTILKSVFRKSGSVYYMLHKFKGRHTYIFFFQGTDGWIRESLKVDLFLNFEFRGRIFLSSREILQKVIPYNDLYIPCGMHQAYIGVVKGILKGGSAWRKYLPRIQDGLLDHAEGMKSLMRRIFGGKTTRSLISNLSRGDIEVIEKVRKQLIYETYTNSFLKHPIEFTLNMLSYFLIGFGNLLNRPNYMIAVLGPDGVGKSTLIERMKLRFQDIFKMESNGLKVFHIRPGLFPTITEILKKKGHSAEKSTFLCEAWHAPSKTISFVRLFCFWGDYLLGYLIKILPELVSYHVVVLDRYFYDLLIDPSRYKINLPSGLMKTLFLFLPKPKVIIVLDAPAEMIYQRKRELNEARIEMLLNKYRELKNEFDNVHILRATNPPEELSIEVVSTFLKSAATRLK